MFLPLPTDKGCATGHKPIGTERNGSGDLSRIGKRWRGKKCGVGQPGSRLGAEGKQVVLVDLERRRRRRACAGRPPQSAITLTDFLNHRD